MSVINLTTWLRPTLKLLRSAARPSRDCVGPRMPEEGTGMYPVVGLSSVRSVLESLRADESLLRFTRQRSPELAKRYR